VAQSKRQKPGKGPNLKPFYTALVIVAVAGIVWIVYAYTTGGGAAVVDPIELTGMDDPQALVSAARGVTAGDSDAPVQVLVFSDFTCPACRGFTSLMEQRIKQEYVEPGIIRYVYYDFPLGGQAQHRHSFIAARAARCAEDQGMFWEYHDLLFGRQGDWALSRTPPLDNLVEYAGLIGGLNVETFEQCLRSEQHADVVTANRMLGDQLGVNGTPTVFIGQRSFPQFNNWEAFKEAVRLEMPAGAMPGAADTTAGTGNP
jgi:protein-disulfide isomerase